MSGAKKEISWSLSGGYHESVAPVLPVPQSFYFTKGACVTEQKHLRLQQDEKLKFILQKRWKIPKCERPPPKMIADTIKMQQDNMQDKQQDNRKKAKQQSEALHSIFQTEMAQSFCERQDETQVCITKDIAVQEIPHRLDPVLPMSDNEKKLEKAEYAMKEYDWRWTRVVDKEIRAICKWTRLMLTIATLEFFLN